ncbi:hypothetical protein PPYR_05160 [Photinus pyralis]|uniref:Selenoprotein S n=1 Tax=Photinus pyralis TaxID=7054 RepID=A0A1Y1KIS6_PHOPY|nr:selenoprotein S-like [Photinus pyralis]KAB0802974.1 hypothetical protein PPYR_05160 [Photinus pyralis]
MTMFDYEGTESHFYNKIIFTLENYGWYLLIASVLLMYVYQKLQPFIYTYLESKRNDAYAAEYHKNPDLFAAKIVAQQEHAAKLQEQYSKLAEEYQKKKEKRETKKREEWLSKQSGYRLGSAKENTLKTEYNPLMGDSSSKSYRPQRKSPCSGGGCGK